VFEGFGPIEIPASVAIIYLNLPNSCLVLFLNQTNSDLAILLSKNPKKYAVEINRMIISPFSIFFIGDVNLKQ